MANDTLSRIAPASSDTAQQLELLDAATQTPDIPGESFLGVQIQGMLGAMEWVEDEIDQASDSHPARAPLLDCAFIALRPNSEIFRARLTEPVVRGHARELLERIVEHGRSADLAPGTAAECACSMMEVANTAPLRHRHFMAAGAFLVDVLGAAQVRELVGEEFVRRAQMDREQEVIAGVMDQVRQHLRDDDRQRAWLGKLEAAGS